MSNTSAPEDPRYDFAKAPLWDYCPTWCIEEQDESPMGNEVPPPRTTAENTAADCSALT